MHIRVRLFASLRERYGRDIADVSVPEGATVHSVFEALFPGLELRVGYALNAELTGPGTPVQEGDEVALLPPLGGG
jgi:molybdopterin converting factor small subunit